MTTDRRPLTAALLVVPDSTASTLYGMFDVFASVGRDWPFITTGTPGEPLIRPVLVGADRTPVRAANGVALQPDLGFAECPTPDLICISDLFVAPEAGVADRYPEAVAWLRAAHAAGATIAAACSGALLVAEAGLLDGHEATTHWAYCDALAKGYPEVTVNGARVLAASGEGQRVLTAGGGTSWQDMALFLIARFFGTEEAMRIARIYLLDWHANGQLPFAVLSNTRKALDAQIADCQVWLADHYAQPHAVSAMVARSGLSERSFKRRFTQATGMPPIDYVHTLRLEEAKQILETTDLPVEAVAVDIGYEDASFFRRLFRRKVGLSPSDYRRRFRTVRVALAAARPAQERAMPAG
ncbi:transcriptional regulator GlxA family with amidase domain [Amorphus suaedae]